MTAGAWTRPARPLDPDEVDPDEVDTVMTIHQATFHKLAASRHLSGQLAEFLEDIAVTYQRLSERLRRTGPRS